MQRTKLGTLLRTATLTTLVAAIAVVTSPATASEPSDSITAKTAFNQLNQLAGSWQGVAKASGAEDEDGSPVQHTFRTSAGGTVIMETMSPGTDHEMINMYHLDGEDLLLTHYCSGGNQPRMRLNLADSNTNNLVFDFIGGTNLNAETDHHIHDAAMRWNDNGTLSSAWTGYSGGKPAGEMVFTLERKE